MSKRESHFVLVHGGCHGAWCWYKVATLLKSAGHRVTTVDLTASGIHPKQLHDIRSISDYYEPLMQFMGSLPPEERVILVGHSLGGVSISVAMEKFPEKISAAVFAAAFMPTSDLSHPALIEEVSRRMGSLMDTRLTFDDEPNKPATSMLLGPNFLASKMYQLSPPEDLSLALSLVRPVRLYSDVELLLKETSVTKEKHGTVPKVYVVCDKDNAMVEDLQRWMIERSSPPCEVKVITGSDHMVMFSKPVELCSYLQEIANKY